MCMQIQNGGPLLLQPALQHLQLVPHQVPRLHLLQLLQQQPQAQVPRLVRQLRCKIL